MSNTATFAPSKRQNALGDSLAVGVVAMLVVNVLQRSFGLIRGIGFASFLSDVDLGRWALMNSFFVIAVPIAVLGLPGSFGKFAEYFRVRGQFGGYFRLVTLISLVGTLLTCGLILWVPGAFGYLVLGESVAYPVVVGSVLVLISVIAFSFVNELTAAFREVRTVSHMQFAQSVTFTVVGLSLVAVYREWWVLLLSFAIAQWVGLLPGLAKMRGKHVAEFQQERAVAKGEVLRRIAHYAMTLWAVNLFSNLFEVADRYMLLHLLSGDGDLRGQAMVGQYHCARILPNLLSSVAMMLGGILLPYLSADWEQGQQVRIAARIKQMVQSVSIGFTAFSVVALVLSPLLFQFFFDGRYAVAQQVLPLALLQATWVGLFLVSEPFMLCAERGRELVCLLVFSLIVNLGLNALLIPVYGLHGAMCATAGSNLFALTLLYWRLANCGCALGTGTMLLSLTPIFILGGPMVASVVLVLIVFIAGRTNWLLTNEDKAQIDGAILPKLGRLRIQLDSLWP